MDAISSIKIPDSPLAGTQYAGSNGQYTLIASNYSRNNYGFAGWSEDFEATATSKIFGPNETITTATDGFGDANISQYGLILYPVWIASSGTLQDWHKCSSLVKSSPPSASERVHLESVTALRDERDNNVYAVARLADDKCWMIENLRLDSEATRGNINQALSQGYGDDTANNRGKFIGLADSEEENFIWNNTVANSLYSTNNSTQINVGTTNNPTYRIPRYNNSNINRDLIASNSSNGSFYQWYGYGNYYNWPATMASTSYFPDYSTSEISGTSLCPNGWKLPQGRSVSDGATSGSFSYLDVALGGTGNESSSSTVPTGSIMSKYWRQFPNNFVYAGYLTSNSTHNRESNGIYWSSSAYDNSSSYYLYIGLDSGGVVPGTRYYNKSDGRSIRCLKI